MGKVIESIVVYNEQLLTIEKLSMRSQFIEVGREEDFINELKRDHCIIVISIIRLKIRSG